MTADVELLPLPELPVAVERFILSSLGPMKREGAVTALRTMLREYALANVLHHTAPMRYALDNAARDIKTLREVRDAHAAEIEALRAEREVIVAEALKYAGKYGRLEAKVDRLAEALRPLAEIDLTPDDFDQRPDSQPIYARNKTAITVGDVRKACAALEQERRPTMAGELIEYLRGVAENANLPQYMRDRLTEAADAIEAASA